MRDIHFRLPHDHQPVECHRWAQEEIAWGFCEAPGEMATPSNMGAIIERIGGSSAASGADAHDPTRSIEAAEQFKRFVEGLKAIGPSHASVLEKVYSEPLAETDLLAFGGAANLFPESQTARDWHRRTRTSKPFISWAGELRIKVAGERFEDKRVKGKWLRHPSRASETEKAIAEDIKRDTEAMLTQALAAYASARPRR